MAYKQGQFSVENVGVKWHIEAYCWIFFIVGEHGSTHKFDSLKMADKQYQTGWLLRGRQPGCRQDQLTLPQLSQEMGLVPNTQPKFWLISGFAGFTGFSGKRKDSASSHILDA